MEKETILSTLKEKLGTTQLSDITLNAYVDGNLPLEGSEPDEAYYNKHVGFLKSLQGQFSNDVAKQIANQLPLKVADYYEKNPDALKEYLSKHPEVLEKNQQQQTQEPNDSKYEELLKQINDMKAAQEEKDKAYVLQQMKQNVIGMAAKNNLSVNDAIWEDAVKAASGSSEDEMFANAKSIYSANYVRVFGATAVPFETHTSFQVQGGDNKTVNNYFARKAKSEGWGK